MYAVHVYHPNPNINPNLIPNPNTNPSPNPTGPLRPLPPHCPAPHRTDRKKKPFRAHHPTPRVLSFVYNIVISTPFSAPTAIWEPGAPRLLHPCSRGKASPLDKKLTFWSGCPNPYASREAAAKRRRTGRLRSVAVYEARKASPLDKKLTFWSGCPNPYASREAAAKRRGTGRLRSVA